MSPSLGKKSDHPPRSEPGLLAKGCAILFTIVIFPFMLDVMFTGGVLTTAAFSWLLARLLGLPY